MGTVRYLVSDVERAVGFYEGMLGFKVEERFGSVFARVSKDGLTLWLSGAESSAARPMQDGAQPVPGGWNRIVVLVEDIEATLSDFQAKGVQLRNPVVTGPGGSQALIEDGVGNLVEVFQARG